MTTLSIFGDESGTMPISDNKKDVFVTAIIATLDELPILGQPTTIGRGWIVSKIKEINGSPFITYIKPITEYSNTIKSKMDKMNTMARMTRLMSGNNSKYLTDEGVRIRNFIWFNCMQQTIAQAILSGISSTAVTEIRIYLDQKSLATPTKNLFVKQISNIRRIVQNELMKLWNVNPAEIKRIEDNLLFTEKEISLYFSNESEAEKASDGLKLTHHLARFFYKDIRKSTNPKIETLLKQEGFNDVITDFTDIFMQPIDSNVINKWEQNTGLREPN